MEYDDETIAWLFKNTAAASIGIIYWLEKTATGVGIGKKVVDFASDDLVEIVKEIREKYNFFDWPKLSAYNELLTLKKLQYELLTNVSL